MNIAVLSPRTDLYKGAGAARPHRFWYITWRGPCGEASSGQPYCTQEDAERIARDCGAKEIVVEQPEPTRSVTVRADPSVVAKHGDIDIKLQSDGRFYARPVGREEFVYDKTLDGLKKKLDNIQRASTRAAAISLAAIALERSGGYWDDDERSKWHSGTFAGINAHTGEISFQYKNGQKVTLRDGAWFFRADHPAVPEIERLLKDRIAKEKAAKDAEKKLGHALEEHGFQARIPSGRDSTATERAARLEQALIEALAPEKA